MTTEEILSATLLCGEKVRMKDKDMVVTKLKQLKEEGTTKLQIITDFDRTVSKHHDMGNLTKSSYCVFEGIPTLPNKFVEDAQFLYNRFRKIEDNPNMTIAEKLPHMEEWWNLNEKLFIGLPFEPESIAQAVLDSGVKLRDKADSCFKTLNDVGVPVLVFSAGLGHVVTAILNRYNILFDNMKVISNFFHIVDGKITGFEGMPMNVYNKNQHAIENCDYFQALSTRTNVIVMGDSLGDANMAEGVTPGGAILKIGFLSIHIDEYLPQYLDAFDIVLLDDQTMDVFDAILAYIL